MARTSPGIPRRLEAATTWHPPNAPHPARSDPPHAWCLQGPQQREKKSVRMAVRKEAEMQHQAGDPPLPQNKTAKSKKDGRRPPFVARIVSRTTVV